MIECDREDFIKKNIDKSSNNYSINPARHRGGGVSLPPDHFFDCHFQTVWNRRTKFGDFSQVCPGQKVASPKLSYHSREIQDGGSKTGNAWKMAQVDFSNVLCHDTPERNFN